MKESFELMTVEEVSEFLHFKPSYIYKLTRSGKLKGYRPFGKRLYYKRKEIEAAISASVIEGGIDRYWLKDRLDDYTLSNQ